MASAATATCRHRTPHAARWCGRVRVRPDRAQWTATGQTPSGRLIRRAPESRVHSMVPVQSSDRSPVGTAGLDLLPVVIRVTRRRAFNEVAGVLPGVTGRVLRVLPRQPGRAFGAVPIAHQFGFRLFERAALVASVRVDTVAVGGTILVKGCPAGHVGPTLIVLAPVRFLDGGVD